MAAEYLVKKSAEQQVPDVRGIAKLDDADDEAETGEEADKNLVPLHYAAWYNKVEAVKSLLKYGADPNEEDNSGATALHYAARYKKRALDPERACRNYHVIKLLIEAGCLVNKQDNYKVTPLMLATLRGNEDAVNELLKAKGIAVNITDNTKWTALFFAAKYNRVFIASRLIENGADIFAKDGCGATPMHFASSYGHADIMNMLLALSKGREIKLLNEKSIHDLSPLDMAVENRRLKAVEICLQHGATTLKTAKENHVSPLHICAAVGGPRIADLLISHEKLLMRMRTTEQMIPLHKAAQYGRTAVARVLIDRGSDLEAGDAEGNTPLLTAAVFGQDTIVRVLLKSGASVTAMNRNDHSAIHLAAKRDNCIALKVLLSYCKKKDALAMINAEDKVGRTPLYLACEAGYHNNAKLLLNAGADMKHRTENEEIPVHVACRLGYIDVVKVLLESMTGCEETNACTTEEDEHMNTPLHLAALHGHAAVAELFVKSGADVHAMNQFNCTPFSYAAKNGHTEVLKVLLKAGADPRMQDENKDTPMHYAARNGHHKAVKTLLDHVNSGAKVCVLNKCGNNVLDDAISSNNKAVVETILDSDQWRNALRNRTPSNGSHLRRDETPLRKLIHQMPELAMKVLDRCIDISEYQTRKDPDLCLSFDMEFLDDTYNAAHWGDPECVLFNHVKKTENGNSKCRVQGSGRKSCGNLSDKDMPYTYNGSIRQFNHPLFAMIRYQRTKLLYHPLSLALIRHKWHIAQYYFYAFLVFYSLFVLMVTYFMVNSTPPYFLNGKLSETDDYMFEHCLDNNHFSTNETSFRTRIKALLLNREYPILGCLIIIASTIGVAAEIIQLLGTKLSYLANATNLIDWFSYVTAIIVVIPVEPCHIYLTHWQWQLGACCMLLAWLNLILFLRRMPRMGIYIVMVHQVLGTFVRFFIFCFSFFLLAFGFTFYVLMENQSQFSTTFYSCVKVGVMMIGELEYADLFHDADIPYEGLTYAVFITFLCIVTIIIMNLLTGLAIGDVQEIQEQAKLKKMAVQAEFALNVETSLPEILRKRFHCVKTKQTLHPNKLSSNLYYKFGSFVSGPLSAKSIASAIFHEVDEDADNDKNRTDFSPALIYQHVNTLATAVESNKDDLAKLHNKMDILQDALKTILSKLPDDESDISDSRQDSFDTSSN